MHGQLQRVLVFGAGGYSGLELLRWLARHPHIEVIGAASDRWSGEPVLKRVAGWSSAHLTFEKPEALLERAPEAALAFLATPAETSLELAPKLLDQNVRVVDLSGAFRLKDAAAYPEWYGFEHPAPALLAEAVYGLPELGPSSTPNQSTRLVANPGCYATAAALAVAPLVASGLIEHEHTPIILDGKSGTTGAGRKVDESLLFSEVADTIRPYRLAKHQHTPEIEAALKLKTPNLDEQSTTKDLKISFTAHLVPMRRGLIVSAYAPATKGVTAEVIQKAFRDLYGHAPFVRVLDKDRLPEPGPVLHTNVCDVGARLDPRTGLVLAFGALDNLVKGAAGQAIQNANRLLGLDESAGLGGPR